MIDEMISEMRGLLSVREEAAQRKAARLLLKARASERYADVLTYATALDADVLAPERLVQWAVWTPTPSTTHKQSSSGLWWIDEDEWCLSVCGAVLATHETLDLQPLQHAWSTVPARAALHVWEDWAREHAPEHLETPRRAIEAKEAWCRGEAGADDLRAARVAAGAARAVAGASACDDVWAAARAAAWVVVRGPARGAARGAAWAAARGAEYQRWCGVWTAHVIEEVLRGEALRQF